ncbi:glycine receptor subunit alpha-2 [Caerostris extrusa]|uniref:Glycine receptor subunit alpha-2 n=1 Tax=Caerostris extrusa TaxID=172846 RepID=A0AAV4Q989_CAEEX|nr:glycine receptor subunit alpha-2 [Caerostris extrusa]
MSTLKQLASDEEKNFPMAAPVIRNDFYMDDVLSGAQILKEVKELQLQLATIYQREGMTVYKCFGNRTELSLNRNTILPNQLKRRRCEVLLAKSLSLDDVIPSDYDRHSPPKLSKGESSLPVNVSVHLWVIQIRSVDEVDMDFKMDVVVRQMWEDHRLLFPDDRSNKLILDASVTLQLSCDMNMKKYPHDSQTCGVSIISLMSPTSDMQLNWIHPESIRVSRLLNLPQFEVGNLSLSRCDTPLYGDVFSCIAAYFTLTRRSGYFVINIYIPTVLIVFMSMLTFWIPPEAVPARITMGVTSLLTIITKQYQSTMPSVSYIVALNIWLSSCIAFVFFSLLEYAVVISLVKKERITPTTQVSSQNTRRN